MSTRRPRKERVFLKVKLLCRGPSPPPLKEESPQFFSYFPTIPPHSIVFPASLDLRQWPSLPRQQHQQRPGPEHPAHSWSSVPDTFLGRRGGGEGSMPLLLSQQTLSGCIRGISLFCSHPPLWSSQLGSTEVSKTHTRSVVPEARKAVRGAGHGVTTQDTDVCIFDENVEVCSKDTWETPTSMGNPFGFVPSFHGGSVAQASLPL